MAEARGLALYTIPPHRAFADTLAAGLMARFGGEATALARGIVIVSGNRARRTVADAFVRASGSGLLLPRIVAVADPALDESLGALFDPADGAPVPPAIAPMERRMLLAHLLREVDAGLDAAEAVRLAGDLARTIDGLLVEEVAPARLRDIALADGLSQHWERALSGIAAVLDRWPGVLAARGRIELPERRTRLLDRIGAAWRAAPPAGFVCAAGVTSSAPAVARLLRTIAGLPRGMVVLPGVDLAMPDEEWAVLRPTEADAVTGRVPRGEPTHPQHHLKLLMDRMGVARGEVRGWRGATDAPDAPPARSRAIATALAPAEYTHDWATLERGRRNLAGVRAVELATPAAEATAIALALREALETPGRTAALVTPDRALAARVVAQLARWDVSVDDSAGRPLSQTPPGTLLLALAEAAAGGFGPLALLALLKHPLVAAGAGRGAWLAGVRAIDLALRGPRPAAGLGGIAAHLDAHGGAAAEAWPAIETLLAPIAAVYARGSVSLAELLAALRETGGALCGDALWSRVEGRAAAEWIAEAEAQAPLGPDGFVPATLPALLRSLLDAVAVRPGGVGHARISIYGLIEARQESADLMILGGLNEGVWPGIPAPDPWLAPSVRAALDLPGLEVRIGLAAHDLAGGLGAPQVLLTRSRRDARSPTNASRFWLRLRALAGEGWVEAATYRDWAVALDAGGVPQPAGRPAPAPPAGLRPRVIGVTDVDRLQADPYALYAKAMLRLRPLEPVDADPSAAWRGTAVHAILKAAWEEDGLDPAGLHARARALMAEAHPLLRALWQPRLMEAIDWISAEMARRRDAGRAVIAVERSGRTDIAGVTLRGTFDRLDRDADGSIVVVDYKTGKPPSTAAVAAGFSLQLGLLGLIAERGGFEGVSGRAGGFEYWSLGRGRDGFGYVASPCDANGARGRIPTGDFVATAAANFTAAAGRWLTGDEPFTAKLRPEYAPYGDYDQLMRLDEWYGRE